MNQIEVIQQYYSSPNLNYSKIKNLLDHPRNVILAEEAQLEPKVRYKKAFKKGSVTDMYITLEDHFEQMIEVKKDVTITGKPKQILDRLTSEFNYDPSNDDILELMEEFDFWQNLNSDEQRLEKMEPYLEHLKVLERQDSWTIFVNQSDYDTGINAAEKLLNSEVTKNIFKAKEGLTLEYQKAIYEHYRNVPCKCLLDVYRRNVTNKTIHLNDHITVPPNSAIIIDVKHISDFADEYNIRKYRNDLQACFYRELTEKTEGVPCTFYFAVTSPKSEPCIIHFTDIDHKYALHGTTRYEDKWHFGRVYDREYGLVEVGYFIPGILEGISHYKYYSQYGWEYKKGTINGFRESNCYK